MSNRMEKGEKHYLAELKELLTETREPREKLLAIFCHRHGISMGQCKEYYEKLVEAGEIKE